MNYKDLQRWAGDHNTSLEVARAIYHLSYDKASRTHPVKAMNKMLARGPYSSYVMVRVFEQTDAPMLMWGGVEVHRGVYNVNHDPSLI